MYFLKVLFPVKSLKYLHFQAFATTDFNNTLFGQHPSQVVGRRVNRPTRLPARENIIELKRHTGWICFPIEGEDCS